MKEKILTLRASGKSYNEIQSILNCSKGLIAYYCGDKQREKTVHRTNLLRKKHKQILVDMLGGCCELCGYKKCLSALEFHHLNPNEKEFTLSDCKVFRIEFLKKEASKCKLLCSNCHREVHENNIDLR